MFIAIHPTTYRSGGFLAHGVLKKATREDIETIWKMQVEAFTELLDKYQDFDMSPATESLEKIIAKFE